MNSKFTSIGQDLARESGSALLGALILAAVTMLLLTYLQDNRGSGSRAVSAHSHRSLSYYETDSALAQAVGWLRKNSTLLLPAFSSESMYGYFDRSEPTVGANDLNGLALLTRVKMQGTSNSIILVSNPLLATPSFPAIQDQDGKTVDVQALFLAALTGAPLVRATLVDVLPSVPSGDLGDIDSGASAPTTTFYPIWRLDAQADSTSGPHVYVYVAGSPAGSQTGIYGEDSVTHAQSCDSYRSKDGAYGGANRFARCALTSRAAISIQSAGYVFGSVHSNGSVSGTATYQSRICGNFTSGCPVPGTICQGTSCGIVAMDPAADWATFCPTDRGNLTITKKTTLKIPKDEPKFKCWGTVTIQGGGKLTLSEGKVPYYFSNLVVKNNSPIVIEPQKAAETVSLYLNAANANSLSSSFFENTTSKPNQMVINYWGTPELELNLNSNFVGYVYAPKATVKISGVADFFGTLRARALNLSGTGQLHYDESAPTNKPTSMEFRVLNFNQVVR